MIEKPLFPANRHGYCTSPIKHKNGQAGFTLMELSIAMAILGLLLTALIIPLADKKNAGTVNDTQLRMQRILDAIHVYTNENGKLPCPARRTDAPGSATFGVETDCAAAAPAGTTDTGGVRLGAVPVRSLNLPDKMITDAWGRRFTYAATVTLADSPATYGSNSGVITMLDENGNDLTTPADTTGFVLFSHGKDGKGSWLQNGTAFGTACGSTTQDDENCDGDTEFVYSRHNDGSATPADYYDDYIAWKTKEALEFTIGADPDAPAGCTPVAEFAVHTDMVENKMRVALAGLTGGGYAAAWESNNLDGDSYGIFYQQYDAEGLGNGNNQANTETTSTQYYSTIAPLTDGGFVITWSSMMQDGSMLGIFGQRFASDGTPAGSEFQANTYTNDFQVHSAAAGLADGGFVVTWSSNGQDGSIFGVYGQRYDNMGTPVGSEFQVNTHTNGFQDLSSVAGLTDGGFVVVWESDSQDGSSWGIYGQRYDNTGTPVGSEFQINSVTANTQSIPDVASLPDGGFVVVWHSNGQDGSSGGVYGQRYDNTGAAFGAEFRVNTTTSGSQSIPAVASLADGGYIVVWESDGQDGDGKGIYAQRYKSNGATSGSEFRVNTTTTDNQFTADVAGLTGGGYVIGWSSRQPSSTNFIYAHQFCP